MPKKQPTWFCPTSNIGFHKIFCTEGNEGLVLQLLNSIIDDRKIVSFERLDPYHQINSRTHSEFDLYCKCDDGSRVIIECQNSTKAGRFINRSLVYSSLAILDQAREKWRYEYEKVYFIGLLTYNQWRDRTQAITKVGLFTEEDHVLVNDKFLQIFVELPKLGLERGEDGAGMQFLRALRDIGKTDERPDEYKDPALDQLFHASMYKHFNKEEQMKYDTEMGWPEDYIDNARNMVLDAVDERSREVAKKMKALGVDCSIIAQGTGLTIEEVEAL